MSKKWTCEGCLETYKLKREVVECLEGHLAEHYQELMIVEGQLEDLGVKEYTLQ